MDRALNKYYRHASSKEGTEVKEEDLGGNTST